MDTSTPTRGTSSEKRTAQFMPKRSTSGASAGASSSRERSKPSSANSTRWKNTSVGAVGVLLRVEHVAAVAVHEVGDLGDDAGAVGTRQQQDGGGAHDDASAHRFGGHEAGDAARDTLGGDTLDSEAAVWLSAPGIDTERRRSRSRNAMRDHVGRRLPQQLGEVAHARARRDRGIRCACTRGTDAITCTPLRRASSWTAWVKLVHERLGRAVGGAVGRGLVRRRSTRR